MNETNKPPNLFKNKLETLLYLKDRLCASNILDLISFSVYDYRNNSDDVLKKISSTFCDRIIIRSSASTEDQNSTNAGHFMSVQHINPHDRESVTNGINTVILSYEKDGLLDSELIFVQKQLTNVFVAGVAFSFVPENCKPYFLVNYDDSGSTDSVTSGKCKKYMYIARDFVNSNCWESKLCHALLEVESYCENNNLDIEFAVTNDGDIYIFQVRRLMTISINGEQKEGLFRKNLLASAFDGINELLSDMAFWNPSEIIGDAPHPLDYSLYRYLVTESAWNKGISEIGYFSTLEELMLKQGNKPYIKLKTTFRSLIPASVGTELREKLTEYYCRILTDNKNLHDKIEFEIIHNCFNFSTMNKLDALVEAGFNNDEISEISEALYQNTKVIIEQYDNILLKGQQRLEELESTLNKCKADNHLGEIAGILNAIKKIMPVIRDCGVIPFACQARCAFIARSLCISMVDEGLIDSNAIEGFMRSIKSITGDLQNDVFRFNNNEIDKGYMENKYGHLRSNSYDVTSPTYSEVGIAEIFGRVDGTHKEQSKKADYKAELNICFPDTNINLTNFIITSLAQREYFKFIFTKALSFVLELILKLAEHFEISRDDIAYTTIDELMMLTVECNMRKNLIAEIEEKKKEYKLNALVILPPVIVKSNDFNVVLVDESIPNYVTNQIIEGDVLIIDGLPQNRPDVSGKIVVIQYADPGYDWVFATGSISGLVTRYGGMGSHMAIRCMEFGIPAAIGCGELIYNQVIKSQRIVLDCSSKKVVIVR